MTANDLLPECGQCPNGMKDTMKRFLIPFISSWWLSPLGLLLCAGLWCCDIVVAAFPKIMVPPMALNICGMVGEGGFVVFLALCLAAVVRALVLKRWGRAVAVFFATGACAGVSLVDAFAASLVVAFADNDHFADDLSVPEGIEIAEPGECARWPGTGSPDGADAFFTAVSNALSQAGTDDGTVFADVPSFARLARENRDILLRYLSAHPGWRVFAERGSLYATRIMMKHGDWDYPLNGFFSDFDYPITAEGRKPRYQVRLTIGFPDPWWNRDPRPTRLAPGEAKGAVLSQGMASSKDAMYKSHVIISAENACIEVDEESAGRGRRLTKALLRLLEEELRPLAESPTPATIASILPPSAILHGEAPDIFLKDGMQGGIYSVRILANPGEPGLVYLKAFEVTNGTPLSQGRLPGTSSLRLGWSDNPGELYSGTTEITIYEGNWGQFYAARFELWFKPDSGAPERKLAEKVFRIQGWQR